MNARFKKYIRKYIKEHLKDIDNIPEFEIYTVHEEYLQGNKIWVYNTSLPNSLYFEFIYNKLKNTIYFNVFSRIDSSCIGNYSDLE